MTVSLHQRVPEARPRSLGVIIPVFNERAVLPQTLERLQVVFSQLDLRAEALFVDDGSQDGSAEFLIKARSRYPFVRLVRLSRNFGKEAALTAGLDLADYDAVVVLDADLQDPPELIPQMVEQWQAGIDVVLMQRRSRAGESALKRLSAHVYYRLLRRLSHVDIPNDTGDFRLLSRRAVDAMRQLPERNRYMKGLFAWIGLPTVVLSYDRDPRAAGASKWDYLGLMQLALDGITSFSISPLRLAMLAGLVASLLGGAFGLWIVCKALLLGSEVQGYPSLMAMLTFLGGIQLLAIGIVGEYVGKTYLESKQRPTYLVRDITASAQSMPAPQPIPADEAPLHAKVR
ncbi:glycosyltransferase family 2 protein [Marinobacteraceae bacterium S3BR75-40.1]